MNIEALRDIVKVAKEQGVSELKVEGKDFKVSVSFSTGQAPTYMAPLMQQQPAPVHHSQGPAASTEAPKEGTSTIIPKSALVDAGLHIIKSPFVGTFYTSSSPSKPIYVKIGDKVKVGQPLCVLEAMKIMNEIDADKAGEIVEICVENESLVEYGQPLFKIKPS
ncbi:MAG TPA: acetyl-CoA carboxylase biotin carboxyl carrier protein [Bacteriovoracaceae bacterium]|nr:acetyl-CoA carboxylase biotin carboxyl carrier protein [Bacteriovoracaceae bacterium]